MADPKWEDGIDIPQWEDGIDLDDEEIQALSNKLDDSMFEDAVDSSELSTEEQEEAGKMGKLEAGTLGFGEGASFGLTPILSGLAGAGTEVIEDIGDILGLTDNADLESQGFKVKDDYEGVEGLLQSYYDMRDRQRGAQEKASEDQFGTYMGGMLGGSLAGGGAASVAAKSLAGAGKAGQALSKAIPSLEIGKGLGAMGKIALGTREGLKAGTIAGFGGGEAKLAEGEIGEAAKESLASGMGGAVFGGGLSTLGQLAGKGLSAAKESIGKSRLSTAFKYGKTGKSLTTEQVETDLGRLSELINKTISKHFKKAGATKEQIFEASEQMGEFISAGDSLEEAMEKVINISARGDANIQIKNLAMEFIEDLKGNPKEVRKLSESMEKARLTKGMRDLQAEAAAKMRRSTSEQGVLDEVNIHRKEPKLEKGVDPKDADLDFLTQEEDYYKVFKKKFPGETPLAKGGLTPDDLSEEEFVQKIFTKKRVQDVSKPRPTEVVSEFDPESGRYFVGYQDKLTNRIYGKFTKPMLFSPDEIDINRMSARQLDDIIDEFQIYLKVGEGGSKFPVGSKEQKIIKNLRTELREMQNDMVKIQQTVDGKPISSLREANKSVEDLNTAMDALGLDTQANKSRQVRINNLLRTFKNRIHSDSTDNMYRKEDFIKHFIKADPKFQHRFSRLIDDMSDLTTLVKDSSGNPTQIQAGLIRELFGFGLTQAAKLTNLAGQAQRGVSKQITSWSKLNPRNYQVVGDTFDMMGSSYANVMRELAQADLSAKKAMFYTLFQQPGFRKELQRAGEIILDAVPGVEIEE